MIGLEYDLFVAAAFRTFPEQLLIQEGIIHRDDFVGGTVNQKHIAAEFVGFLKRLKFGQRIEVYGVKA